jgi:hypothetical protein
MFPRIQINEEFPAVSSILVGPAGVRIGDCCSIRSTEHRARRCFLERA